MRYKLEVDNNGKLKTEGSGSLTQYYVLGFDGSHGMVSKDWVKQNINCISNVTLAGDRRIYAVVDRFEKACCIIQKDMKKQIGLLAGLDIKSGYRVAGENHLEMLNELPAKATAQQAWKYIYHFGVDNQKVYFLNLNALLGMNNVVDKQKWLLTAEDTLRLYNDKQLAERYACKCKSPSITEATSLAAIMPEIIN